MDEIHAKGVMCQRSGLVELAPRLAWILHHGEVRLQASSRLLDPKQLADIYTLSYLCHSQF